MFKRELKLTKEIKEEIGLQVREAFQYRDEYNAKITARDKARAYLMSHGYTDENFSYGNSFVKSCGCKAYFPSSWKDFDYVSMGFCNEHNPDKNINFPYKVG